MALNAEHVKRVISRYSERLARHREALNRLNVYPVPDGDTGTNMSLTVQSVVDEVRGAESMAEVAGAIAHGSLMRCSRQQRRHPLSDSTGALRHVPDL